MLCAHRVWCCWGFGCISGHRAPGLLAERVGEIKTINWQCILADCPWISIFNDDNDDVDDGKCNNKNSGKNDNNNDGQQRGGGKAVEAKCRM
jgi:hypothetical protein